MSKANQAPWPRTSEDKFEPRSPTAFFLKNDVFYKSDRSLAGPLRLGTEPRVGPRGASRNGASDLGMDRVSPRGFDPMGTALDRYGPQESSPLVSRELRGARRREG